MKSFKIASIPITFFSKFASQSFQSKEFSLPMHTELDDEQLKLITDSVLEFMK